MNTTTSALAEKAPQKEGQTMRIVLPKAKTARAEQVRRGRGRPPNRATSVAVPMPPTGNNPRSAARRQWHAGVAATFKAANVGKIVGLVAVSIRASEPGAPRDLASVVNLVRRALLDFAVIEGGAHISRLMSEWSADVAPGSVEITVRQIAPPAERLRISQTMREAARQQGAAP